MNETLYFRAVVSSGNVTQDDGDDVVLDHDGSLPIGDEPVPLLISHSPFACAGRVLIFGVEDRQLVAYGVLFPDRWEAQTILAGAAGGAEWGCSIGIANDSHVREKIEGVDRPWLNGRSYSSPVAVDRHYRIAEVSATVYPADQSTSLQFGRFAQEQPSDPMLSTRSPYDQPSSKPPRTTEARLRNARHLPVFFRDDRNRSWQVDMVSAETCHAGDFLHNLVGRDPEAFGQLLQNRKALADLVPLLCRDGRGNLGEYDPGLAAWLADPRGDAVVRVGAALAEALVASHQYHSTVIHSVAKGYYLATSEPDERS